DETDTNSPAAMENAPAASPASPVSRIACCDPPPPPTPAISETLVTSPSMAPNTAGRSQPPDTSLCSWPCASFCSLISTVMMGRPRKCGSRRSVTHRARLIIPVGQDSRPLALPVPAGHGLIALCLQFGSGSEDSEPLTPACGPGGYSDLPAGAAVCVPASRVLTSESPRSFGGAHRKATS